MKNSSLLTALVTAAVVVMGCTTSPNPKAETKVTETPVTDVKKGTATLTPDTNVSELATQARLVSYPNDIKREGLLVQDIDPGTAWSRIGLEKGDVIARVGDTSMATADGTGELFRAVANPGSEKIEILRPNHGKRRQRMYLPLDPK